MSKRIESISIRNIYGIERAEFPLGTLTVLQGDNGTGKTSILSAISAVFEGGHNPDWLRNGAEEGEIILSLSDGVSISAKVRPDGTKREVRTSDGSLVNKPATFIERLAAGFAFDPIGFLEADEEKQVKWLLKALPIRFTFQELADASGRTPAGDMDLQQFQAFRDGLYEDRRRINVEVRNIDGTISTLSQSLPDIGEGDWCTAERDARETVDKLRTELATAKAEIEKEAAAARGRVNSDLETKIAELRVQAQKDLDTITTMERDAINNDTAEIQTDIDKAYEALGKAEANAKMQIKAETTRKSIEQFRAQAKERDGEASRLTYALEKLDKLKLKKLADCNVPGIEIQDGRVVVGGVPLKSLNTQKQYFTAFQVAALAPGELGFMVCDRSESIVGRHWDVFQAAAQESGFQVACARSIPNEPLAANVDGQLFPVGAPAGASDPNDGAPKRRRRSQ